MSESLIQILSLVGLFVLGIIAGLLFQHAFARQDPDKITDHQSPVQDSSVPKNLTLEMKERLQKQAENRFQAAVDESASLLQHDLKTTTEQINSLTQRLATTIVNDELEKYKIDLERLQKNAAEALGSIRKDVQQYQAQIESTIKKELETEKAKLIRQIDTKLNDAVVSFLLEALQHNIDLGSQSNYLMKLLEEHKDEFKKEINNAA